MTNLLRAMGFWIWGLLAVVLSVSVITVSYRMSTLARSVAFREPVLSAAPVEAAHAASDSSSKSPSISRVIAKEMRAAQAAMQVEDWNAAIKSLDAAASKFPLTAFDRSTLAEFRAFNLVKLRRLKEAQAAYAAALAAGGYSGEAITKLQRSEFSLAAGNSDHAQTVAIGTQLADAGNATPNDLAVIAQAYFLQKDCMQTALWANRVLAADLKAGIPPKENLYLFKLQCASDSNDQASMVAVLYDLIRLAHKSSHWNILLRIERQNLHDDHNTLQLDRLMYDTGAMTLDTDFLELAQLLIDQGIPGEGVMVLKTLIASKYMKPEHRDRAERLLASATRFVDTASDNPDPDAVRSLLLANASEDGGSTFGAPTSLERTATRSQLQRPEELNLYLARVLIIQGDFAGGRTALQKFIALANPTVATVWKLYADTLPEPAPAPAPANAT